MNSGSYLDALLSVPALHGPQVSPDGSWVAWSWSRIGPAADVFAAPTDGSASPTRLTETANDTLVVSWTPDGRAIVVAQDREGDERAQLSLVRLANPGTLEPLTEPSPHYYVRGGQVHRDGRWLVYGANLDDQSGQEIEETWIYRHDLKTGERRILARPERGNYHAPQLNTPGDEILYHRNDLDPAGLQVWLVDIEGRNDREILNFGPRVKVYGTWFSDGRRVLFVVEAVSYRRLGVWEDGSVRWLLDDPLRNVEYAFVPPSGGHVVVAEVERTRIRATLLDDESGAEKRHSQAYGSLIPLSPADGGRWIGLHYGARYPVDIVRFSPAEKGETPESITGLWDRVPLDPQRLIPAEDFSWRSVDGLEVQGWLYRTPGYGVGTILLVHGGPTSHAEDRFNAQIQYLLSRGFNVLTPNYRGSTGFGLKFQESIKEDGWGGREQEDIRCGIEALVRAGIAQPGRIGVTGTSYGGYSAWWAITHFPPDLVAAAAPVCGMTDLVVDYYATRPDLRPYSEEMMGGSPDEVPERYHERSPINFVRNISGRVLIVQGLKDPNVTPDNVHAITQALDDLGLPYEVLSFDDEGHGITRPKNLEVLYTRMADFFESAFSTPPDGRP